MKYKYPLTLVTLVFCFSLHAKPSFDYFDDFQNKQCKPMIERDGPLAINACISLMVKDSKEKLSKRISEIEKELGKNKSNEIINAFIQEQKLWLIYKRDRCRYFSANTEEESYAYNYMQSICQAAENYRRIETLIGEPGYP